MNDKMDNLAYADEFAKAKPGFRVCGCCLKELHESLFYKDGYNKDGSTRYRRDCKACYMTTRKKTKELKNKKLLLPVTNTGKKRGKR